MVETSSSSCLVVEIHAHGSGLAIWRISNFDKKKDSISLQDLPRKQVTHQPISPKLKLRVAFFLTTYLPHKTPKIPPRAPPRPPTTTKKKTISIEEKSLDVAIHGSIPPSDQGSIPQGPLLGFWLGQIFTFFGDRFVRQPCFFWKAKNLKATKIWKIFSQVFKVPRISKDEGIWKGIVLPSSCIKGFQGTYVSIA